MTSCVCAANRSASRAQPPQFGVGLVERATPSRRQMRDVDDDEPVDRVQERLKDRFINRVSRADDEHVRGNRQTGHERDQARSGADVQTRHEYRREEQDKRGACPRQRREQNTKRKRGHDRAECDEITRNGVSRQMIGLIAHRRPGDSSRAGPECVQASAVIVSRSGSPLPGGPGRFLHDSFSSQRVAMPVGVAAVRHRPLAGRCSPPPAGRLVHRLFQASDAK